MPANKKKPIAKNKSATKPVETPSQVPKVKKSRIGYKHSEATKKLISEKRRARTVQPRSGTSKKAKNFFEQLICENFKDKMLQHYLKTKLGTINTMELLDTVQNKFQIDVYNNYERKQLLEWLNRPDVVARFNISAEDTKNIDGINCDYHEQYNYFYMLPVGQILFDPDELKFSSIQQHHDDEILFDDDELGEEECE